MGWCTLDRYLGITFHTTVGYVGAFGLVPDYTVHKVTSKRHKMD